MALPGIEPGFYPSQGYVLTTGPQGLKIMKKLTQKPLKTLIKIKSHEKTEIN